MNNGKAHGLSTIIRNVMSLVFKAELTALYLNAKDGVFIRNKLE